MLFSKIDSFARKTNKDTWKLKLHDLCKSETAGSCPVGLPTKIPKNRLKLYLDNLKTEKL